MFPRQPSYPEHIGIRHNHMVFRSPDRPHIPSTTRRMGHLNNLSHNWSQGERVPESTFDSGTLGV